MKPLEEIFFKACIHEAHRGNFKSGETEFSVRDIVNIFSRLGFPHKQLWWYLEKWVGLGFYTYGVTLDLGWFELDKFTPQYETMYKEMLDAKGITEWKNGEFVASMSISLNAHQMAHAMANTMIACEKPIDTAMKGELETYILQHLVGATGVPAEMILGSKVVADGNNGGVNND